MKIPETLSWVKHRSVAIRIFLTGFLLSGFSYAVLGFLVPSTTFSTANGVWKLSTAALWSSGEGHVDFANVLFMAVATSVFEIAQAFDLTPTRVLVWFNSAAMAFATGFLGLTIYKLTKSQKTSVIFSVMFALSGGALTHALGSEDIAGAVFGISVAFFFLSYVSSQSLLPLKILLGLGGSLAFIHLWEWRAALPLCVGICVAWAIRAWRQNWRVNVRELTWVLTSWVLTLFSALLFIVAVLRLGHSDRWFWPLGLIFPGKGLGTVWAGFSTDKITFEVIGLFESIIGGRNVSVPQLDFSPFALAVIAFVVVFFSLGVVIGLRSEKLNFIATASIVSWLAAVLFNLYSQPQDPQMQVTQSVQLFLWAAVGYFSVARAVSTGSRVRTRFLRAAPLTLALASVCFFQGFPPIWSTSPAGDDEQFEEAQSLRLAVLDAESTLYGSGWEPQTAWIALANNGVNINHVGFHGPWQRGAINGFFPVSFIASNPNGSAQDWVCASWVEIREYSESSFIRLGSAGAINFSGFATLVDSVRVEQFESLWAAGYGSESLPKIDRVFLESYCDG